VVDADARFGIRELAAQEQRLPPYAALTSPWSESRPCAFRGRRRRLSGV